MSPDKDAALRAAYPNVFRHPLINGYPIQCRDGWFDLVDRLCRLLEFYIVGLPETEREHFYAEQVKEKFGGLRFYMTRGTPDIRDAISAAEKESLSLCDVCGEIG